MTSGLARRSFPSLLQRLVRHLVADMERRDGEIEKLRLIVKQLERAQFGRRVRRLPEHLPRQDVTHDIKETACPCCGGGLRVEPDAALK